MLRTINTSQYYWMYFSSPWTEVRTSSSPSPMSPMLPAISPLAIQREISLLGSLLRLPKTGWGHLLALALSPTWVGILVQAFFLFFLPLVPDSCKRPGVQDRILGLEGVSLVIRPNPLFYNWKPRARVSRWQAWMSHSMAEAGLGGESKIPVEQITTGLVCKMSACSHWTSFSICFSSWLSNKALEPG